MKKCLSIILVFVFLLTLNACQSKNSFFYTPKSFSSHIKAQGENIEFTGKIDYDKENSIALTVISPDRIKGTVFEKNGDNFKITYDNTEIDLNGSFKEGIIFELFEVLSQLSLTVSLQLDENFSAIIDCSVIKAEITVKDEETLSQIKTEKYLYTFT